jgi:hypothetical protein
LGGYARKEWDEHCFVKDDKYEKSLAEKDQTIKQLINLSNGTPEDCKRGTWCEACVFAMKKTARIGEYPYYEQYTTFYCNKEGACKRFTRKGVTDAETVSTDII